MTAISKRLGCNVNESPTYARPQAPPGAPRAKGPSPERAQYKVIVSPTREGWRYVVQMRRSTKHPWTDFAPFRSFTSRAEAERYLTELQG